MLHHNLQHEPKASDCKFWDNTAAHVVDYLSNSYVGKWFYLVLKIQRLSYFFAKKIQV